MTTTPKSSKTTFYWICATWLGIQILENWLPFVMHLIYVKPVCFMYILLVSTKQIEYGSLFALLLYYIDRHRIGKSWLIVHINTLWTIPYTPLKLHELSVSQLNLYIFKHIRRHIHIHIIETFWVFFLMTHTHTRTWAEIVEKHTKKILLCMIASHICIGQTPNCTPSLFLCKNEYVYSVIQSKDFGENA